MTASEHTVTRSVATCSGSRPRPTPRRALPAWPLLALLFGLPLFWVTGLSLIAAPVLAAVMLVCLALRGGIRSAPGTLLWLALLAWIVVCALSLTSMIQGVGFALRWLDLVAVGIAFVYYVNAPERVNPRRVLSGFVTIWMTMVFLGLLALVLPEVRFTTPLALLLPDFLMSNELARELMMPRLAEVQQPWGAEEPFVRPAAPFPYTNSWGMAYALLTPLVLVRIGMMRRWAARVPMIVVVAASMVPAAQTSNRGMLIALGLVATFVALRLLLAGHLRRAVVMVGVLCGGVAALTAGGVFEAIADRQAVSDTTSGRSGIYRETLQAVLESPLVGWATPRMDVSIGIALGTQGFAWQLMFSYGFVGLAVFLLFFARVLTATWRLHGMLAYVLQGVIATAMVTIWFYGLGVTQCLILLLACAMLCRAGMDGRRAVE